MQFIIAVAGYICGLMYKRRMKCILIYDNLDFKYSETLNNEYMERIHQMSYSSLSDNGMLQIFSFLIN